MEKYKDLEILRYFELYAGINLDTWEELIGLKVVNKKNQVGLIEEVIEVVTLGRSEIELKVRFEKLQRFSDNSFSAGYLSVLDFDWFTINGFLEYCIQKRDEEKRSEEFNKNRKKQLLKLRKKKELEKEKQLKESRYLENLQNSRSLFDLDDSQVYSSTINHTGKKPKTESVHGCNRCNVRYLKLDGNARTCSKCAYYLRCNSCGHCYCES